MSVVRSGREAASGRTCGGRLRGLLVWLLVFGTFFTASAFAVRAADRVLIRGTLPSGVKASDLDALVAVMEDEGIEFDVAVFRLADENGAPLEKVGRLTLGDFVSIFERHFEACDDMEYELVPPSDAYETLLGMVQDYAPQESVSRHVRTLMRLFGKRKPQVTSLRGWQAFRASWRPYDAGEINYWLVVHRRSGRVVFFLEGCLE